MVSTRKNTLDKKRAQCEQILSLGESNAFESQLEKTPLYRNQRAMKNIEKKIIERFNTPFSPSKITANNDFYTYINYLWLKDTSKQKEHSPAREKYFVQVDSFRIVQNKVYIELMDIVKDYIQHNHSKKSNMIRNVYNSLYNLKESYTRAHIAKFTENYETYVLSGDLWDYMAHVNQNEIVSWACPIYWKLQTDEKNVNTFQNKISFPQLSIYDYLVYIDELPGERREVVAYRKAIKVRYLQYINEIFEACLGKRHGLVAQDVFDVEYELLTAMGCDSVKNDSDDYYNVVKKDDALSLYGFNWEKFSLYLGYKTPPDFFICDSLNYLKCVCKLLQENWTSKKWKSYWFYIYLKQIIRFDHKMQYIYYKFNGEFLHGQPSIFPRDLYPVFGMSFTFNTFLTNAYVEKNRNIRYINYVENMGKDLITVYKRIIRRNTWLSPSTKKYALLKLEKLKLIIGVPTNMREDPLLDYSPDDAWGNMLLLASWKTIQYINLGGKDIIDVPVVDWNTFKLTGKQSYIVNAFYTPTENSIYIPLAYLQPPFIDLNERGIEYNLAQIGQTLCHEMSHALDDTGSKYDYDGNLRDWWTAGDKVKYKKIIADIITQYETYAAYDGIKFDAAIGVGEDMADISSLKICEEYLRDFQMKNSDVIPIASLSFQAFFIYFAVQQRQHVYKKAVKAQLKTNPHPMDKYRTNVPLSRLELFRSLYNVKKGDKMWWKNTNTIW